jgi:hypothetical protein
MTDKDLKPSIKSVFFQPEGIKPDYCEVGIIFDNEPEYVYYASEPCKILVSKVKIIPNERVIRDNKPPFSYRVIKNKKNELTQSPYGLSIPHDFNQIITENFNDLI